MNDKWYWSRLEEIFELEYISLSNIDSGVIDKMVVILRDVFEAGILDGMGKGLQQASDLILEELR